MAGTFGKVATIILVTAIDLRLVATVVGSGTENAPTNRTDMMLPVAAPL